MTKEELLIDIANEHSYEDWGEYMYDTHPHTQIEASCEAMDKYAIQQSLDFARWLSKNNWHYYEELDFFYQHDYDTHKGREETGLTLYNEFIKQQTNV